MLNMLAPQMVDSTLCGCVVNPLGSCVSDARNLGETALRAVRGQPSAEIVRVECVKSTLCHWGIGMQ